MKRLKTLGVTGLVATSIILGPQGACPAVEASARWLAQVEPRIKAIYETDEFHLHSFGASWLPDGSGYLKLETPDDGSGAEIARYDSASGEDGSGHWLYEPESVALRPVKAVRGARFDANAFSPNERRLLGSRGPDLIVYDMAGDPTYPKMNIHYGYTSS